MRNILPAESNPALREKAREIPLKDIKGQKIRDLIEDMSSLLSKEEYGVAIAASQVGEAVRLFVVSGKALARHAYLSAKAKGDDEQEDEPEVKDVELPPTPDQVYINPTLVKLSRGKKDKHEGCLSVRGKWGMVPRAEKATITAYDEHGVKFTRGASGFLAHIFQHEMDHLEGILYTDKATDIFDDKHDHE